MAIINPSAGSETAPALIPTIRRRLATQFDEVDLRETTGGGDATDWAREAAEHGDEAILAVGGDGTINEVIHGIAEHPTRPKLALLPMGTGNLLARRLGYTTRGEQALDDLRFEATSRLDIGRADDRYFTYIYSIGDLSEAIHVVDAEEKSRLGIFAYARSMMRHVNSGRRIPLEIVGDDFHIEQEVSLLAVVLSRHIGSHRFVGEDDEDDTGLAHVLCLHADGLLELARVIPDFLRGTLEENEHITYLRTRRLRIETTVPVRVVADLDGDEGDTLPTTIDVLPRHLELYLPAQD